MQVGETKPKDDVVPVKVNDVVDPSAAVTDQTNTNFVPQTKPELEIAFKQILKSLPVDKVPVFYKAICDIVRSDNEKEEKEQELKRAKRSLSTKVENKIVDAYIHEAKTKCKLSLREVSLLRENPDVLEDLEGFKILLRKNAGAK